MQSYAWSPVCAIVSTSSYLRNLFHHRIVTHQRNVYDRYRMEMAMYALLAKFLASCARLDKDIGWSRDISNIGVYLYGNIQCSPVE